MPEQTEHKAGERLLERLASHPAARKWALFAGFAGIALIFLSGMFSFGEEAEQEPAVPQTETAQTYAETLEEELSSLLSRMVGVGDTQILVTLEQSSEQVYATEERGSNRAQEGEQDEEWETTFYSVRGSDGSEQALPVTEKQPVVRGVVVVCTGGGDPAVRESVTTAVTTALDISSARVCVLEANQ